jgi:tetratricopeptide (TPR) repeat protein
VNKLTKFTAGLFVLLLFVGCRTGMPLETTQEEFQNIEHALLEGKWDAVMTDSEKLLVKEPDNVVVRFLSGLAYYMNGRYDLQEEQYEHVLKDKQSMDDVVVWCEKLAQRFPQNYYALFVLGSAYPIRDEDEKAIESYKRAIEIDKNLPDAYVGLGAIYAENEQIDEAAGYYKKAIEVNPSYVAAYLNLGALYEYDDQNDKAIASYEKAIEINPRIPRLYIALGRLYLEKGDRDKAVETYKKVIELEHGSPLGIYAREMIEKAQSGSEKGTADTKDEKKP